MTIPYSILPVRMNGQECTRAERIGNCGYGEIAPQWYGPRKSASVHELHQMNPVAANNPWHSQRSPGCGGDFAAASASFNQFGVLALGLAHVDGQHVVSCT